MNIQNFLNEVDKAVRRSTKEQLAAFLHQYAGTLAKEERERFLIQLTADNPAPRRGEAAPLPDDLERIKSGLVRIASGELCLIGSLNEEYDDWYNEEKDFYRFEDPDGVVPILEETASAVSRYLSEGDYTTASSLAQQLLSLEIQVEGEYTDYSDDPLSLKELADYELTALDLRRLRHEAICAVYQTTAPKQRPAALYALFQSFRHGDETIEGAAQAGPEDLKEFPDFLRKWMEYLAAQPEQLAKRLLKEAAELIHDGRLMLEVARNHADVHPELYLQLLQSNPDGLSDNEIRKLGLEALDRIDASMVVRSEIALTTAETALRLGDRATAERCWLEAFRSHTTAVNLLRLRLESNDFSVYADELEGIIRSACNPDVSKDTGGSFTTGILRNRITSRTQFALLLFLGRFEEVIRDGMNVKASLGWSSTFMKTGLSLFLLLLYEGDELSSGGLAMCERLCDDLPFSAEDYGRGLDREISASSTILFWECFRRWKRLNPLTQEQRLGLVAKAEGWVELRVTGIVGGTKRNYYDECAAFIAALGEAAESGGVPHGKRQVMEAYQAKYPRHSAFRQELVAFGLPKRRK